MSQVTENQINSALSEYRERYLGQDLVSAGAIKGIDVNAGQVTVRVELGFPVGSYGEHLKQDIETLIGRVDGVEEVSCRIDCKIDSHAVQRNLKPVGAIRNIIAVASGKGGVGKSTTAVNMALALAADGAAVGLLDADIYGPSQPRMLGLTGKRPSSPDGKSLQPLEAHGIRCMSIGFLIDEEQPMVWRGPMVTQALTQLINDTNWGELDYLIVDMPPGTGDTQLTLSQRVPVSGAVIVTTPQDIALLDARKGLKMFEKVEVSVLGIIENMSTYVCPDCGHETHIFGKGGGERMALQYDVPFLGALPLDIHIREDADMGRPSVVANPDGPAAKAYFDIARTTAARLASTARDYSHHFPRISVEET